MSRIRKVIARVERYISAKNLTVIVDGTNFSTMDGLLRRIGRYERGSLNFVVVSPTEICHSCQDTRVKFVNTAQASLSAMVEKGLTLVESDYVVWLGRDGAFVKNGLNQLVDSLAQSKSDAAIGYVAQNSSPSSASKRSHSGYYRHVTIHDIPTMVWNDEVGGVLFRTSALNHFLSRLSEQGSSCIRANDFLPMFMLEDHAIDLLDRLTYQINASSIVTIDNADYIRFQLHSIQMVFKAMESTTANQAVDEWLVRVLDFDLRKVFLAVPGMDQDYWDNLSAFTADLICEAKRRDIKFLSRENRILANIIANQTRTAAKQFICSLEELGGHGHIEPDAARHRHFRWVYPHQDNLLSQLPGKLLAVAPSPNWFDPALLDYAPQPDGSIVLSGQIPLINLSSQHITEIVGFLVSSLKCVEDSQAPLDAIPISVERIESELAAIEKSAAYLDQSKAGYQLHIPAPSVLQERLGAQRINAERLFPILRVTLTGGAMVYLPISRRDYRGSAAKLIPGVVCEGMCWCQEIVDGTLAFRLISPSAYIDNVKINGKRIQGIVTLAPELPPAAGNIPVRFCSNAGASIEAAVSVLSERALSIYCDIESASPATERIWNLQICHKGKWIPCVGSIFVEQESDAQELSGDIGWAGEFRLKSCESSLDITDIDFDTDKPLCHVTVTMGRLLNEFVEELRFDLAGEGQVVNGFVSHREGASVTITFDCTIKALEGGSVGIPAGEYLFRCEHSLDFPVTITVNPVLMSNLPRYSFTNHARYLIKRLHKADNIAIQVAAPLRADESGDFNQNRLIQDYLDRVERDNPEEELEHSILFCSFEGQNVSDSPRGIDEVLAARGTSLTRYWAISNPAVHVPDGAKAIVIGSKEWFRVLRKTTYIVTNTTLPNYFRKRLGQVYVQTWHGTPLKKIGHDVPTIGHSYSYREVLRREAHEYWDYLIAQTPEAGNIISRAFDYDGPVLDRGYPRNDALIKANFAGKSRDNLRRDFKIAPNQRVIFYAPTWRDNLRTPDGRYSSEWILDIEQFAKHLGEGYVILTRAHAQTVGRPADNRDIAKSRVVNIPQYMDVNVALIMCDLLVTDYSSIMFDYVGTGKPILLFAPDVEEYQRKVRGFYFDLSDIAPSKLITTESELARSIQAVCEGKGIDRQQSALRNRFAAYDDGNASRRIIDALQMENSKNDSVIRKC